MKTEQVFKSITHGKLNKEQVFQQILSDLKSEKDKDQEYVISVGTDSQTYQKMKIVTVIAIHKVGKGGKFFYYEEYLSRPNSVREKLYEETQRSLDLSKDLTEFLYENEMDFQILIHVDMGESKKGKTYELINEIMGWITAEGFVGMYKPDSNTASEIADRLSK